MPAVKHRIVEDFGALCGQSCGSLQVGLAVRDAEQARVAHGKCVSWVRQMAGSRNRGEHFYACIPRKDRRS